MPHLAMIGGSPSSGTTLLLMQLMAHPNVLGLHETGIFSHPGMYQDYEEFRLNFLGMVASGSFKLLSEGDRLRKGLSPHLLVNSKRLQAHDMSIGTIKKALDRSTKANQYIERIRTELLQKATGKTLIVEKTPSNVYAIPMAHKPAAERIGIVIVRDPLDVVSSLSSRGLPVYRAMAMWIVEASLALVSMARGAIVVRYEDLVSNPEQVRSNLFTALDLPQAELDKAVGLEEWPTDWRNKAGYETDDRSVGRGMKEFDAIDTRIFSLMSLRDYPGGLLDKFIGKTGKSLAKSLGYEMPDAKQSETRVQARISEMKARSEIVGEQLGRSAYFDQLVG
ncbi:MAG: sulfotransferase family protein [Mesorhizobium sp.]